ncbi:uncharacterized protein LOC132174428 [Corylus avellana]|uniref:uncharacterized protein LOC132174428 n=1 Tax=Corylus avellana TaxID=13451 RepID=UPI00286C8BFB|nr:uncharacterized protein LOC132174428 [Corylus avellana]
MASSSSSSAAVRSWRTAFLTMRDETLASGAGATPSSSIPQLLQHLVFSHSQSLVSAAPHLPPHEVTSDILFMLELVASNCHVPQDMTATFSHTSNLIRDVCRRVSYEISSSSWSLILDSFANMLEYLLNEADSSANAAKITSMMDCLETIRRLISARHRKCSPSEDIQLVKFLLRIIVSSHSELICSSHSIRNQKCAAEMGKRGPRYCSLWEVQTVTFSMLGETVTRDGSSIPDDVWKSMIEVLRRVMDFLASKSLLVEDNVMSRFYASLLHCLHLVLMDPKCSISDHRRDLAQWQIQAWTGLSSSLRMKKMEENIETMKANNAKLYALTAKCDNCSADNNDEFHFSEQSQMVPEDVNNLFNPQDPFHPVEVAKTRQPCPPRAPLQVPRRYPVSQNNRQSNVHWQRQVSGLVQIWTLYDKELIPPLERPPRERRKRVMKEEKNF